MFLGGFPGQPIFWNAQKHSLSSTTTLTKENLLEEIELGCLAGPFKSSALEFSNPSPWACLRNKQPKVAYYLPPVLHQGFPDCLNVNIPSIYALMALFPWPRLFYDEN